MKKGIQQKKDSDDIPKTTILVLVFLAVMISILGTWTVLTTIEEVISHPNTAQAVYQSNSGPTGAAVGLHVEERSDEKNG